MIIKKVQLKDFRNWRDAAVELGEGINVFEGRNAQGKTNLLEALYLASVGKSMRTPRDRELIRWDCERAFVAVDIEKKYGEDRVETVLGKTSNKCVSVNGMPLTRLGELMGMLLCVLFSPEEIKTVKESPSERRRFLDIALCQLSKNYFYRLNRYNKVLAQRNRLLKNPRLDKTALDVWDMQLAAEGAGIVKSRRGFVEKLLPDAKKVHAFLTDGAEDFALVYEGADGYGVEQIQENLMKSLRESRDADLRTGFTHSGPHKDDLKIEAGGADMRTYGSQGQQRTAALTLRLALLELMTAYTGERPVLLLDDVMSELDAVRRKRLLEVIKGYQTVITCTELDELSDGENVRRFTVRAGTCERIA